MVLNEKYLIELYNKIEKDTKEELNINNIEDFIDYIKAIIISNLQYDLSLEINIIKLFKKS